MSARGGNRDPFFFQDRSTPQGSALKFDRLSKADIADAFCHLYREKVHMHADGDEMIADIARRVRLIREFQGGKGSKR